jgi:hypothetical protein
MNLIFGNSQQCQIHLRKIHLLINAIQKLVRVGEK